MWQPSARSRRGVRSWCWIWQGKTDKAGEGPGKAGEGPGATTGVKADSREESEEEKDAGQDAASNREAEEDEEKQGGEEAKQEGIRSKIFVHSREGL